MNPHHRTLVMWDSRQDLTSDHQITYVSSHTSFTFAIADDGLPHRLPYLETLAQ